VSGPEAEYCRGVARIGVQVAEALTYAHKQGILHRDIKPSNLLLDAQGTVWITDFGLAKAEGTDELTHTGDIVGTIRFMAPERFEGKSLPQSDVYALGVTLYELLTLRPAFDDTNKAKLIGKVVHDPPLPPRAIDPRIPRDLETVVLKCLAKEPRGRYASAEAVAEDLQRFLADRPIWARRASNAERTWRWCRRNPLVATLSAVLLLVLTVTAVGGVVMSLRLNDALGQAQEDRDKARGAERGERRKLFEAYLAEAKANRFSGRTGQRFETLARVKDAAVLARELDVREERLAELRQVAVTALAMPDLAPRYLGEVPADVRVHDLSDDLTRVLLGEPEEKAHVVRAVAGGRELFRLPRADPQYTAWFGPGGRHIVRENGPEGALVEPEARTAELWRVDGPRPRLLRSERFAWHSLAFRPDASVLAMTDAHGTIALWDLETGAEIKRLPSVGGERRPAVALHPTEPLVASCSYVTPRVVLRDYRTGRALQAIRPPWSRGSTSLVWHPDGKRLFVAAGDSTDVQEYFFDPSTRQLRPGRPLRTPWSNGGNTIVINPAGDRLVNCGWTENPGLLDLETGQALFQQRAMKSLSQFHFAADGRSVIGTFGYPRGRVSYGVFAAGDAREVRTIPLSSLEGWQPLAVHPGGRLVVVPQLDRFTFVDLATLREVGSVKRGTSGNYLNLAFDGKGRLYSNSFEGCFRWPVRLDGERLTVGPPERLPFQPGREGIAASADGQTVAQAQYLGYGMAEWAGGWLLSADRPHDPFYLSAGAGMMHAEVSRDGRWACFGINSSHFQVFDARTGKLAWNSFAAGVGVRGQFTPDGRWLVSDYVACRVGNWEARVVLDPSRTGTLCDVSPDSRLALLGTTEGYTRLVEIATGRELVRIEPPDGRGGRMTFTPDGTRLLEQCGAGLRVWDLRRIRRELARYGLDWNALAYPPEPDGPSPLPPPLQLTVLGRDLLSDPARLQEYERGLTFLRLAADRFDVQGRLDQALWLMRANRHAEALPHLQLALLSRPESYAVRMNKGRCLMRLGRVEEAVPEFTAAARARPEDYRPRHERAQAYKRLGRHAEAAGDLTAVLVHFPEDAEFYEERAACYAALGDTAREAADRAATARWLPRSARGLNNRARRLLTGAPGEREPERALELSRKAVAIEPDEPMYLNTLGVALYRNCRWTEAIDTLEKGLAQGQGKFGAFGLFFLAMCHAQLDDRALAKDCFDRAVAWAAAQKHLSPLYAAELQAFRAEAEEVLRNRAPPAK
jgi:tetratricopeptide (TPR) repeat protein/WD40 repeat protein